MGQRTHFDLNMFELIKIVLTMVKKHTPCNKGMTTYTVISFIHAYIVTPPKTDFQHLEFSVVANMLSLLCICKFFVRCSQEF